MIPTKIASEISAELKGISDNVQISIKPESVVIGASNHLFTAQISIHSKNEKTDDDDEVIIVCQEPYTQFYRFSFFCKIEKIAKLCEVNSILLEMGPQAPLHVLFCLELSGNIHFYIAPMIEDEDEE